MFSTSRKTLIVASIALAALTCNPAVAAEPEPSTLTNTRQETQIWTTYALSPHLRAFDISVSVNNGQATLTGEVDDDTSKELAEQIALGVNDISKVNNQLVVREGAGKGTTTVDRGYGEVIDDLTITTLVKSKLLWSKHAAGLATNVDTNNGHVTLKGTADSGATKEIAQLLAESTDGVTSVDNQLVVKANSDGAMSKVKNATKNVDHKISDTWITTKVKSTLLYSSNVKGSGISVDTKNGVVTLSGKLGANSDTERALAIQLAENINGVKSVNADGLK